MTVAICIKCGATKFGALARCRGCGFVPQDHEEKAKSMIVTDRLLSKEDLESIGDQIRKGQEVRYPPNVLEKYIEVFEKHPEIERQARRYVIGCFVVICLILLLIVAWLTGLISRIFE